ncbi:lipopolysaccharide biosynthesis protein [Sphingobium phenoxybenzoativorans]|uniref:lipopolysaccharide biosynthesis protein n=1 Tax=Sphingobium phenoxybenzoativorans TaxID=1592790 RepID=UPI001495B606|nr:lipopolysaccharide biosynthesis protein [Sphingobium phenoxybenzoativorans]
MSIKRQVARGSVWISAARLLSNVLTALSTIVLAAYLAPSDFGIVAIATSVLAVFGAFTELSLANSLIAIKDPDEDHYYTAWSLGAARGLALSIVLAAASPFVAKAYGDPRLEMVMLVVALTPLITGLRSPLISKLQKELRFHQSFYLDVATSLSTVVASIALAAIFQSYWAIIIGTLVGQVVGVAISYAVKPFMPRIRWRKANEMWRFSLWLSLGQIISTINYRVDQLLVGAYLGNVSLGLYTVGGRLAQIPGREVVRPLTLPLFPAFSMAVDSPDRLKSMYRRAQNLVTAVALPITAGLSVLAGPTVHVLMGDRWTQAVPVIQIMAAVTAFETLGTLVTPLAMAKHQTQVLMVREIQKFAVRLPLLLVGILLGGFPGLIAARAVAALLGTTVDMWMVRTLINLPLWTQLADNWRSLTATGVMVGVVWTGQHSIAMPTERFEAAGWLAVLTALGGATYLTASLVLWRMSGRPNGPESEMLSGLRDIRNLARS